MKTSFPEYELFAALTRTLSQVAGIPSRSLCSEFLATIRDYCRSSGLPMKGSLLPVLVPLSGRCGRAGERNRPLRR